MVCVVCGRMLVEGALSRSRGTVAKFLGFRFAVTQSFLSSIQKSLVHLDTADDASQTRHPSMSMAI